MSISLLESKEKRLHREIESSVRKIERYTKSKQKTALSNLLKENKILEKKQAELGKVKSDLAKERKKESKKQIKEQNKYLNDLKRTQQKATKLISSGIKIDQIDTREFDIFISYVQSDSSDYVDKLYNELVSSGIIVFRDTAEMKIGQSMRQSMDNALAKAKFAIVIFSPDYLSKYWTQYELDGILSKEYLTGEQMILPLWHNITADELASKSPSLANKLAWNSAVNTIDEIASTVKSFVGGIE